MNTIRFLITGMSAREVRYRDGESLRDLINRLVAEGTDLPLQRVTQFFVNGQPVPAADKVQLRPGLIVSGAPKLEGGLR
jgi:hypothetical protein